MHCVLSYDLGASGERRAQIESQILVVLKPYQYVRPLSAFFIVHMEGAEQWNAVLRALSDVAALIPEKFNFILSPLMNGSLYNGYLPKEMWQSINALTIKDVSK